MSKLKKGAEIELNIDSLAFGAEGIGRVRDFVVFISGAIPGQRVKARILREKKSFAYAKIVEVVKQSPHYVEPRCPHFSDCGGCALQHFSYEKQILAKAHQVKEILQRIGHISDPPVLPTRPSPTLFYYRNKMEYTFGDRRWLTRPEIDSGKKLANDEFALGLHVQGFFAKILPIQQCFLQSEKADAIRNFIAEQVSHSRLRPYTTRDHSGFWRFLVIREGKNTGEIMINLVTADRGEQGVEEVDLLAGDLIENFPETTTLIHTINRTKAQVATGQESRILHGPGYIFENLAKWRFRISPDSFFQTNTTGAEILYQTIADFADLQGNELVYDLYCGAGSIAISLSEKSDKIIGMEIASDAIQDARTNAQINDVNNCDFVVGDLKDLLDADLRVVRKYGQPDVIVLDPPRAGIHPKVLKRLIQMAPTKIIYVSCNPATFARDVAALCDENYRFIKVQPVDMFPHTAHIETVSLLEK